MGSNYDIIICDQRTNIVRAWKSAFVGLGDADIRHGDLLEIECDAYVSPANSFGVMDGGDRLSSSALVLRN